MVIFIVIVLVDINSPTDQQFYSLDEVVRYHYTNVTNIGKIRGKYEYFSKDFIVEFSNVFYNFRL